MPRLPRGDVETARPRTYPVCVRSSVELRAAEQTSLLFRTLQSWETSGQRCPPIGCAGAAATIASNCRRVRFAGATSRGAGRAMAAAAGAATKAK
eukprot:8036198-Pyramimonas_sp.AAC.1